MAVREGLLALLEAGPRHGYQLKTEFEGATGGIWPLNVGQVYTTLDRLERDGLVDVELTVDGDQNATKIYAMTAEGREALGQWWAAVPSAADTPPRDELMLKVLMSIERGPEHALPVITHHRTALTSLLQQRRRAARSADPASSERINNETIAARLVDDALIVRAEADLRWLDLCESRIQSGGRVAASTEIKELK